MLLQKKEKLTNTGVGQQCDSMGELATIPEDQIFRGKNGGLTLSTHRDLSDAWACSKKVLLTIFVYPKGAKTQKVWHWFSTMSPECTVTFFSRAATRFWDQLFPPDLFHSLVRMRSVALR